MSSIAINPLSFCFGHRTQLHDGNNNLPRIQLILGIDFGTAFTKIVIAETRVRYAVPVGDINGYSGFCLPCSLYSDSKGNILFKSNSRCKTKLSNLKMPLIEGCYSHQDLESITAYLAKVMQSVRAWFFEKYASVYKGKLLDWNINIGLPTENFHDTKMVGLYQRVVGAAWHLSTQDSEITLDGALSSLNLIYEHTFSEFEEFEEFGRLIHPDQINCFPEFVALVSGYVRSPQREKDLHALVDVGAGTADVTVFNVHRDSFDEDIYPIFAKNIGSLGTYFLLQHRNTLLNSRAEIDPTAPVPDDQTFSARFDMDEDNLAEIDKDFCTKFRTLVAKELRKVKIKRYPRSPRWKEGVPCFLCGGGGNVSLYRKVLEQLTAPDFQFRIKLCELPNPADLEGLDNSVHSFDRLLVAYGLSNDPFDIGKIIKSQDVPDDEPVSSKINYESRYVSKDML
jgi:hypothetical protein